jgi:putative colanic acid biosynthesis acetyltransferase WcaF
MITDLSAYNNAWYKPGSFLKRILWHYTSIIFFKSGIFPFYGLKIFLLILFGAKVGKKVLIKPFVNIKYPWFLILRDFVWIGENVWIDNLAEVLIGNNVCLSQGAMLLTGNHNYLKPAFDLSVKEIIIEDGVWIGAGAVVCPGVMCKSHSVLMVGSVATKDMEQYTVYQGNPAEKIKNRIIT